MGSSFIHAQGLRLIRQQLAALGQSSPKSLGLSGCSSQAEKGSAILFFYSINIIGSIAQLLTKLEIQNRKAMQAFYGTSLLLADFKLLNRLAQYEAAAFDLRRGLQR
jgi:hypothetical protein